MDTKSLKMVFMSLGIISVVVIGLGSASVFCGLGSSTHILCKTIFPLSVATLFIGIISAGIFMKEKISKNIKILCLVIYLISLLSIPTFIFMADKLF